MSDSDVEYFAKLGQRFGRAQDEQLATRDVRAAVRARLLSGAPRASSTRLVVGAATASWGRWRGALVPALVLAAGLLLFFGSRLGGPAPLTFVVGAGQGQAGQLLAAQGAVLPLRFSDGSLLELTPQARSRVLEVAANGARVELERGVMRASVVHRPDTVWAVLAGPFQVAVTGTRFTTRWEPLSRELEVVVQEGSVLVSGGTLRGPERVTSGKTLRVVVTPSAPQAASAAQPSESAAPVVSSAARGAAPKAPSNKPDADAFHAVFEAGSPTDLVTLSEALRQRGDGRGATRALLALRSRFPSDPRSVLAARTLAEQALGRRDCGEAQRWLEAYTAQAPAGAARELAQRVQGCAPVSQKR